MKKYYSTFTYEDSDWEHENKDKINCLEPYEMYLADELMKPPKQYTDANEPWEKSRKIIMDKFIERMDNFSSDVIEIYVSIEFYGDAYYNNLIRSKDLIYIKVNKKDFKSLKYMKEYLISEFEIQEIDNIYKEVI